MKKRQQGKIQCKSARPGPWAESWEKKPGSAQPSIQANHTLL